VGVLNGALQTGKTMATDFVSTATTPRPASPAPPPSTMADASSPAHDVPDPGSGEEKL
jgi:hypothetical protein